MTKVNVSFLSETDQDYAFIEARIREGNLGGLTDLQLLELEREMEIPNIRPDQMACSDAEYEKYFKYMHDVANRLPTRFDSLFAYGLLDDMLPVLAEAARDIGVPKEKAPKFLTLPTGRVNAIAVEFDENPNTFLIFDSGLFPFCNLCAKAFALCIPISADPVGMLSFDFESRAIKVHMQDAHNQGIRTMRELLEIMVRGSALVSAPQYWPPKDRVMPIEEMRAGMEVFVVGHEYTHFFLDHNRLSRARKEQLKSRNPYIPLEHTLEHDADLGGLHFAMHMALGRGSGKFVYTGIESFFGVMMILDRYRAYCKLGTDQGWIDNSSHSHPSWMSRRHVVRESMKCDVEPLGALDEFRLHCAAMDLILDLAWQRLIS